MPEKTVFIGVLCTCRSIPRQLDLLWFGFSRRKSSEESPGMRKLLRWIGAAGLTLATQACVVRDQPSVNAGYYPGVRTASVSVATPSPYTVSTMPPDPLF